MHHPNPEHSSRLEAKYVRGINNRLEAASRTVGRRLSREKGPYGYYCSVWGRLPAFLRDEVQQTLRESFPNQHKQEELSPSAFSTMLGLVVGHSVGAEMQHPASGRRQAHQFAQSLSAIRRWAPESPLSLEDFFNLGGRPLAYRLSSVEPALFAPHLAPGTLDEERRDALYSNAVGYAANIGLVATTELEIKLTQPQDHISAIELQKAADQLAAMSPASLRIPE